MTHIRILRHYIHTPFVILAVFELLICFCAAYLGYFTRFQTFPASSAYFGPAALFALTLVLSFMAMGVYGSRLSEGFVGMTLRTAVSIFLISTIGISIVTFLLPDYGMGRGVYLLSASEAFILLIVSRWLTAHLIDEDALKRVVLVLGTGTRAAKIATRMRRRSDRRGFILHGYHQLAGTADVISQHDADIVQCDDSLAAYCEQHGIHEIVVAVDDRRNTDLSNGAGLPMDELVECRMNGVEVTDVLAFIEREAAKLDVDLLQPSWIAFSDGFVVSTRRQITKRAFDLVAATALFLVVWPIIAVTALAIAVSSRFKLPVFYKQARVGLNGAVFDVIKFRSMSVDAEADGAVWAAADDPRVTRIGNFIRQTRIDELPQLLNVIRGDMSFVGPRPERPVFVEELNREIPYFDQRHRIKPGITGWAQLCYPYGASIDDHKHKLEYDLYYLKNNSLVLDVIILLQTLEVVLAGDGAR